MLDLIMFGMIGLVCCVRLLLLCSFIPISPFQAERLLEDQGPGVPEWSASHEAREVGPGGEAR